MRLNAGLPKEFWAEATNMAVYVINRSPGTAIDLQIPEEKWTSRKVDYSDLRTFGCSAYVHVQKQERSKLDPKSKPCLFMGFKEGVKGYKLWDPVQKKMFVSRDVIFDEKPLLDKELEEKKYEGTVPCQKDTVEAVGELQEFIHREEEP